MDPITRKLCRIQQLREILRTAPLKPGSYTLVSEATANALLNLERLMGEAA